MPSVPAGWLQRALNALNQQGAHYPDIKAHKDIGDRTLRALDSYLKVKGAEGVRVMLEATNVLQGERYIMLSEVRTANESFVYGWLRRRIELVA